MLLELVHQVSGASSELTRYFYMLMKLCEYLIHTEALAALCREEGPVSGSRRLARPSMGDFAERLPGGGPVVEDREVLDCLRALDLAAARNREGRNRLRKLSYQELCRVLCQVRQKKARLYYNGAAEGDTWRYLDYVTGRTIACDAGGHVTAHRLRLDTLQEWKEELS